MNILFVLHRYPGFGGIETVTHILANAFVSLRSFRVAIFSTTSQNNSIQLPKPNSFSLYTCCKTGTELKLEFNKYLERESPDIIIYQDSYSDDDFLLSNLDPKYKIIVCEHNSPDCLEVGLKFVIKNLSSKNPINIWRKLRLPARLTKLYTETMNHHHRLYELCDGYVILSEKFRISLQNHFNLDDKKVVAIPNPILFSNNDINVYAPRLNQALFVGRLVDQKGITYLIELWEKIEHATNWSLVVIGDGDRRSYLENQIRRKQLKRIHLKGYCSDPTSYYINSSVHFMTSVFEGFGMTNIEASSCGTIPFAFDSFKSASDIIDNGKSGFLIRPFDIDEYFNQFIQFTKLDSISVAKMRHNAIIKSKEFSIECILSKWDDLFENLYK